MATSDTRSAILDAAERLFAEHGFGATSIREITRAAGVNVAAVHYHFGTKEAVLRGVTDRIVQPLNARRVELLEQTLSRHNPAPVDALLEAFIRPDVETLQQLQTRGPTVAHFIGRVYSDQTPWIQQMALDQFAVVRDVFFPALAAALPHLTPNEIAWRITRITAVIVHMFATWPDTGMSDEEAESIIHRYVTFLAPALAAPAP